jgi:hypothetical protein
VTLAVLAAVCVAAGFVLGRVTSAPARLALAVSNPVSVAPASSVPAQRQAEQETPPPVSKPTPSVVLLNPGTATPQQTQDGRDAPPTTSELAVRQAKRRPAAEIGIRGRDERERTSYPARDYRELREYLFRR